MWAVMEGWRAFVRAGQQVSPYSNELTLGLAEASEPGTLRVVYGYPIRVNMLASRGGLLVTPVNSLNLSVVASYQAVNAWPTEVALAPVAYGEGSQLLEIRVSFCCDSFSAIQTPAPVVASTLNGNLLA